MGWKRAAGPAFEIGWRRLAKTWVNKPRRSRNCILMSIARVSGQQSGLSYMPSRRQVLEIEEGEDNGKEPPYATRARKT